MTVAREKLFTMRVHDEELASVYSDAAAFGDTAARWTRRCWALGRASMRPAGAPELAPRPTGAHSGPKRGMNGGKPPKKGAKKNGKASSKKARKSRR